MKISGAADAADAAAAAAAASRTDMNNNKTCPDIFWESSMCTFWTYSCSTSVSRRTIRVGLQKLDGVT